MLALPLIPPPSDQSSWHEEVYSNDAASLSAPSQTQAHHHRQQRQQRDEEKRSLQARSPLALLAADEAAIAQRKAAIRNFGPTSTAGIEEAQQRAAETAAEQEAGDITEDRDLDEDVPEAEDDATFNEDSMLEGSQIEQEQYEELEEAELLGIVRDEETLGIEHERNLDDSVPEAAAYQSSDEANSTSESELEDSFAMPDTRPARPQDFSFNRPAELAGGIFDRTRLLQQSLGAGLVRSPGSMTLSSPQVESSFAASSPVRARANRDTRAGRRGHS
ncbi:hypothetical protein AMS68_008005 [Peltaster fructicola]|uniref:Uncharacterized protein n=1 Tax=Peltaster fructicola TaxID=286661 RepID=A0A6H0Y6K7_9PEZI|nr:hypothetical protein AMS68_008005 [Peltaster fructicola]